MKKQGFLVSNIWVAVTNVIVHLRGLILIPLLIKYFGKDTYGSFVLLSSLGMIVFQLSSFGIGFNYKRYIPSTIDNSRKSFLFYNQFYFHLISILLFIFIIYSFEDFFNHKLLKINIEYNIVYFLLFVFVYFIWNQTSNFFRLTHRVFYYSINQALFPVLSVSLILLIYFFNFKTTLNNVLLSLIITLLVLSIINTLYIIKEIGFQNIRLLKRKNILSDISYGYPLILYYIVDFTLGSSDRFIIAFFLGATAISFYNPAYVLGSIISIIPRTFSVVLQPFLSSEYDKNYGNVKYKKAQVSIDIFLYLSIPYIFGLILYSKEILTFLTDTSIANRSYLIAPIIALGILFFGLNNIFSTIYFVKKKTFKILIFNLLSVVLNLSLNFILLYVYRNIIVAALTTLLSYFVTFIIFKNQVKKETSIFFNKSFIIKVIISSIIMFLCLIILNRVVVGLVMLKIFFGVFIYIILTSFFRIIKINEFLNLIRR